MSDKAHAKQIVASAEAAISEALDDYCGTPPRKVPWAFPGPPPWVWDIASELTAAANTLQEGALRTSLIQISGRVLDKGLGAPSIGAAAAGRGQKNRFFHALATAQRASAGTASAPTEFECALEHWVPPASERNSRNQFETSPFAFVRPFGAITAPTARFG